ncbi:hypothetical protein ACFORJ_01140 [Corynebacterium hansenii]|uniref:Uncharacterized protein n=1 Tax=Corynebacterium hansenii TaxID=394964 RepID=A0ABV7ZMZ9_9CORY|nr:hypothetical protein [Corynebacterium hansenii]
MEQAFEERLPGLEKAMQKRYRQENPENSNPIPHEPLRIMYLRAYNQMQEMACHAPSLVDSAYLTTTSSVSTGSDDGCIRWARGTAKLDDRKSGRKLHAGDRMVAVQAVDFIDVSTIRRQIASSVTSAAFEQLRRLMVEVPPPNARRTTAETYRLCRAQDASGSVLD